MQLNVLQWSWCCWKWTASFVFVIVCSASDFLTPFMFHPSMYCNAQLKKKEKGRSQCEWVRVVRLKSERERERGACIVCVRACVRERERESKTTRETFLPPLAYFLLSLHSSWFCPTFYLSCKKYSRRCVAKRRWCRGCGGCLRLVGVWAADRGAAAL